MFKKLSEKIGFTQTEIKVILFLIITLSAGFFLDKVVFRKPKLKYKNYDYSEQDSIFENLANNDISSTEKKDLTNKKVDYKREVLDFKKPDFKENSQEKELKQKSINLNSAGISQLELLPGIGNKTAQKIIKYRKKIGSFTELKDLIKVKGIGQSKFNNIKKFLYIEH